MADKLDRFVQKGVYLAMESFNEGEITIQIIGGKFQPP